MRPERWADVPGWDGAYEVSDRGRVRSTDRTAADGRSLGGTMLATYTSTSGYIMVSLGEGTMRRSVTVHRLVITAFKGTNRRYNQVRHLDGDRTNNVLSNLRWGTQSMNEGDKKKTRGKKGDRKEESKAERDETAELGRGFPGLSGCVSYFTGGQDGLW